jgi:hypothetical protein
VGNFAVAAFDPSGLSMWGPPQPKPEPPLWKKPFIWVWNAIQPAPGDLSYLMNPIGPAVGLAANLGDDGARAAANSVDDIITYCRRADGGRTLPRAIKDPAKVKARRDMEAIWRDGFGRADVNDVRIEQGPDTH